MAFAELVIFQIESIWNGSKYRMIAMLTKALCMRVGVEKEEGGGNNNVPSNH